jgi:hypothetical protein
MPVKFKLIFFIFNAIVLFSFLFISLLPVFMLGWEYAAPFWQKSWYLLILFLAILGGLDWYFLRNWKFFSLMESQKWDDVQDYLENRMLRDHRYSEQGMQVLIEIYARKMQIDKLIAFAEDLKENRPALYRRNRLNLSVGYLLKDDYRSLMAFFDDVVSSDTIVAGGWADWFWAFSALRNEDRDAGLARFRLIATRARDELLLVITLYMMISVMGVAVDDDRSLRFLAGFKEKYHPALWAKKIEGRQDQIYIRTLSAVLQQAGEWILNEYVGVDGGQSPVAEGGADEQGT